jgi:hypothetical protein
MPAFDINQIAMRFHTGSLGKGRSDKTQTGGDEFHGRVNARNA